MFEFRRGQGAMGRGVKRRVANPKMCGSSILPPSFLHLAKLGPFDGEFGTMFNANSTGYSSCQSNDSDGDQGTISDHTVQDNPTNIPSIEQVTIATQTTQPQMPEHQQTVDPSCAHGLVYDDTCILSYRICRESALVYWQVEGEYGRDQGSRLGMWKSKMDSLFFSLRHIRIFSSMILKLLCPSSKFSIKRGLRQGDPLSPFWFINIMEGLHLALKDVVQSGLLRGTKVMTSLDKGGLGVGSLKAFNLALLQKWRWRLVNNLDVLWACVIKAIHGIDAGMDGEGCKTKGGQNEEALLSMVAEIGNVSLSNQPDSWHRSINPSGIFTTRTWMPIEEDVKLKRKRTPHRDKLLKRERKADEKRTIRVTTIERETFREDHNIGGSRQRFEMPFKVTGLSNHGQSLGSEISANSQMRAKRKPAHKSKDATLTIWKPLSRIIRQQDHRGNPTGGYEGIRRFEDYHGDGNMDGSLAAKEKGRVEHFGITLKEEEEGKHKLMHTSYCQ
ncbi:hypothetical protein Tco_1041108 [Tanacetum coccineum]|uniref:Reverse transcriptase domain-containing protein n=1 Tax=Tanacetum coccineum TaxID=301880 RepID=A0ABQ5GF76_9ASTR